MIRGTQSRNYTDNYTPTRRDDLLEGLPQTVIGAEAIPRVGTRNEEGFPWREFSCEQQHSMVRHVIFHTKYARVGACRKELGRTGEALPVVPHSALHTERARSPPRGARIRRVREGDLDGDIDGGIAS